MESIRTPHPLSVRLVSRLDLRASPLTAFVAPRAARRAPAAVGRGRAAGARASEVRGDEEFAGLRAYAPGVPLKHMAWKVLARGGEPAVRSYTGLAAQPRMAGLVGAARPRRRGATVATVPLGARVRGRARALTVCGSPAPRSRRRAARASRPLPARARALRRSRRHEAAPASAAPVTYPQLRWICACLALALRRTSARCRSGCSASCAARRMRLGLAARGPAHRRRACGSSSPSQHRLLFCSFAPSTGSRPAARCLLDRGLEAARDADAARSPRHRLDHLFFVPRGAAARRILLAVRISGRGLLAHDGDPAAAHGSAPLPAWRASLQLCRPVLAQALPLASFCGCSSRASTGPCGACRRTRAAPKQDWATA